MIMYCVLYMYILYYIYVLYHDHDHVKLIKISRSKSSVVRVHDHVVTHND